MSDNKCVCCGTSIPEGHQVCPLCIKKSYGTETVDKRQEKDLVRATRFYNVWENWLSPFIIVGFIIYFFLNVMK